MSPGLFFLSAGTLALEIVLTRIFSVRLWHHVTYMAVTACLLGFGAAGAWRAIRPVPGDAGDARRSAARDGILAGLAAAGVLFALSRIELDTSSLLTSPTRALLLFLFYLPMGVPFFFAGRALATLFTVSAGSIPFLYGVNLAGSAAGCLAFPSLVAVVGGQGFYLSAAALLALGGSLLAPARGGKRFLGGGLLVSAALGALAFPGPREAIFPLVPLPGKLMGMHLARGGVLEHSVWSPLCRVDVVGPPGAAAGTEGQRYLFQDGDAVTVAYGEAFAKSYDYDASIYSVPYLLVNHPDVLVIGVGGGGDVRQALVHGARSVTGAEINPATVKLMEGPLDAFTGGLYRDERVTIRVAEGRSFLRRSDRRYDVIHLTGTDTYAALSSGSYILSESYLYTREAFEDYLDHLTDRGVLALLRFRFDPPRETLRAVTLALEALESRGVPHPEDHILIVSERQIFPPGSVPEELDYAMILMRRQPFTAQEVAHLQDWCRRQPSVHAVEAAPALRVASAYDAYLQASREGRREAYAATYPYLLNAVTDDSPFFFKYHRWSSLREDMGGSQGWLDLAGARPIGLLVLGSLLLETALAAVLVILLPLGLARREGLAERGAPAAIGIFASLGLGFLGLEIALMQRMILFLGHPATAISVVLGGLLFFAGLGSFFSERIHGGPWRAFRMGTLCAAAISVLYAFALPPVFRATLGLASGFRVAIALALLAPLGLAMGMPFPSALRGLGARGSRIIPWALGVNGAMSVVASVAAILLAMASGFEAVFLTGAGLYLMALALGRRFAGERTAGTS